MFQVSASAVLQRLPLATLFLTERCNSRCVTCDYWRHGRLDMTLADVHRWLPGFEALGTKVVLVSGGEPLINPEWPDIAGLLGSRGIALWLLTSGLSLAKHARRAHELFAAVTVSLDGTCAQTYAAIRGLDAFDRVCEGIEAAVDQGTPVSVRVTVQRANFRELRQFVSLARRLGARQVSFLAADVGNPHAFGRNLPQGFAGDIALRPQDLAPFAATLDDLERDHAADFESGFIAERPGKLRRILEYYTALCGAGDFPPVRCNAPQFSAVIAANGRVQPCFFIGGPPAQSPDAGLETLLNSSEMVSLRNEIRAGRRQECATCVCSLWRDPQRLDATLLPDWVHA